MVTLVSLQEHIIEMEWNRSNFGLERMDKFK